MSFEDTAESIDPEIYKRFKEAVELGKWPDGRKLTVQQKEICLQAMMLFEDKNNVADPQRVGYVDSKKKTPSCDSKDSNSSSTGSDDTSTIRILDN